MEKYSKLKQLPPEVQQLLGEAPDDLLSYYGGYFWEARTTFDLTTVLERCHGEVDWLIIQEGFTLWGRVTHNGGGDTYFFSSAWVTPTREQRQLLDALDDGQQ